MGTCVHQRHPVTPANREGQLMSVALIFPGLGAAEERVWHLGKTWVILIPPVDVQSSRTL